MPLRDRTGPEGRGPLTGRKLGACDSTEDTIGKGDFFPPRMGPRMGRGFGRRRLIE